MIELQWHKVVGNNFHCLLRVTPEDQKHWRKDPRFTLSDMQKRRYLTLGAGPRWGRLVSAINRKSDAAAHVGAFRQVAVPIRYAGENAFITSLLALDSHYGDHLDYDLFPAAVGEEKWYVADDGYNSNSYVSGLLYAAGVKPVPQPPVNAPGYQRPVPARFFSARPG